MRAAEHGRSVLKGLGSVLVLAPHPDDEVIACASVLSKAARAGLPCKVVLLTDGEAHEAAYAVLAARRASVSLSPDLRGGAVRMLLGSRARPEIRVVVALFGHAAAGAEARLMGQAGARCVPGEWRPVSARRWVALPCPIGTLVPKVEIRVGRRCCTLRPLRLVGREDRLYLGKVRLKESCAALRKLGLNTEPFFAHLADGKAAEWWDREAGQPAGRGVAVFEQLRVLAAELPGPLGVFAPSMYDRDMDHKGVAAMTGLLGRRLSGNGHSVVVFRYLVHHPDGDRLRRRSGNLPNLPAFDVVEPGDSAQKRAALRCYVSQLRVDMEGRLLEYAGNAEMFWRDAGLGGGKEPEAWW